MANKLNVLWNRCPNCRSVCDATNTCVYVVLSRRLINSVRYKKYKQKCICCGYDKVLIKKRIVKGCK